MSQIDYARLALSRLFIEYILVQCFLIDIVKEVLGNEDVAAVASNLAAKERIERASCLKLYWKSDMQSVTIMRGTGKPIRKNSIVRFCQRNISCLNLSPR